MRGLKDFLRDSLSAMVDYIVVVSTPGEAEGFSSAVGTDLGRHERSVHLHLREHKCVLCGSLFARKDTLVRCVESAISSFCITC